MEIMETKLEHWPLERLTEYARNPRKNDHAVDRVAAAIREFGFKVPVVARSDGTVVDGHLRLKAARKLGLESVPVLLADDLTDAQVKAFRISVNRMAELADWDTELLKLEFDELQEMDFDLDLTGFDADDLAAMLPEQGSEGLTDPDEIPDAPEQPVTVEGDVWLLGRHRIICGDSTSADVVAKLLGDVKPHLMVTDPPYGVEYDAGWRNKAMPAKNDPKRWKDGAGRATGAVLNDNKADWREAWALFHGDVAYIWHAGNMAHVVAESLLAAGFGIRSQIVWAKNQFVIGRGHYHPHHEPCWYAVRERQGATGHWNGDRKQSTLWHIDKPKKSETGHSTQKPVECMKRPIENNSSPGQAVYEPFSGSGTTIIAGEMTGRHIYAIELNPAYVDVAIKRWQDFTGEQAVLESDGRTFADIAGDRGAA